MKNNLVNYRIFILFVIFISLMKNVEAQHLFVRSEGTRTCGEALSDIRKNEGYRHIYTSWISGFISAYNYKEMLLNRDKNNTVTETISEDTLSQLWVSKCSETNNVTKIIVLLAHEIYMEAIQKKQ